MVGELSRVFHARAAAWEALPVEEFKDALETSIVEVVREHAAFVATLAADTGHEPRDFRCTLLLTVLYRHGDRELACLSQVGDGFIAGINGQGVARRYDPAGNAEGAFSGEVNCFVPDDGCAERARPFGVMPSTANLQALLLCTDGIEDPFYPVEENLEPIFRQFLFAPPEPWVPGLTWAAPIPALADKDPAQARERLAAWLAFEKKGENDDRTAMLVYREPEAAA